ncbi:hypothetical protein K492DRAFT_173154 [Lichtheimia hyalospora FSU 10163]|nr:hypothetical protein K492DRAFT_173154 [Lichtheimia hyalospora FSU 10163]
MDFCTTKKRFGDIKALNHLMALSAALGVIGTIAIFFPVDINIKQRYRCPGWISQQANIFVPGLFVPTLFVMHGVSLTPTKKVA